MAEKKSSVPKPDSLLKKEERDSKLAAALTQLRAQRRTDNKLRREQTLKRAQQYEAEYLAANQSEITARRQAKLTGQIHVPAQPKLAFVVRIRGINKLNPKVLRILRLLRLRQIHNGVFVRVNKASANLLRRVEPYITFGYPSRETIRKLVLKRGFAKLNRQRIPLSDNAVVREGLGKTDIESVEDLINQIHTVGEHFKEANNFLWPFKLRAPRGGFAAKRHPFQRRGDWGNREEYINQLVSRML
jgi:large subunit ribosomal protein L7e